MSWDEIKISMQGSNCILCYMEAARQLGVQQSFLAAVEETEQPIKIPAAEGEKMCNLG